MSTVPNRPLPESYRRLNEFAVRFPAGAILYEQGTVPDRLFVVLSGRVQLAAPAAAGTPAMTGDAVRGQIFGHLPAFAGRPAATSARVVDDAVLIAVPVARTAGAFASAPELAIEVARDLAAQVPHDAASEIPEQMDEPVVPESVPIAPVQPPNAEQHTSPGDGTSTEAPGPTATPAGAEVSAESSIGGGWAPALTRLSGDFDESFFFKDTTDCPACDSRFEYLRVRTSGVRPKHRDSDFYVSYRSEDPTRYAIVVCPTCSFAAIHEDADELTAQERAAIVGARQKRGRHDYPNLCGIRSLEESLTAWELAQDCYALRPSNERRNAALLQRRAWIERERGDAASERVWIEKARDAYRRSFELDTQISEESAMRVAYLIGDLSLRLDDPYLGAQWLETATRFPEAKSQTGLVRLARERLGDARKLLAALDAGAGAERQSA